MSLRFKSLSAAFGISIALWVVLIQGAASVYRSSGSDIDGNVTASIPPKAASGQIVR